MQKNSELGVAASKGATAGNSEAQSLLGALRKMFMRLARPMLKAEQRRQAWLPRVQTSYMLFTLAMVIWRLIAYQEASTPNGDDLGILIAALVFVAISLVAWLWDRLPCSKRRASETELAGSQAVGALGRAGRWSQVLQRVAIGQTTLSNSVIFRTLFVAVAFALLRLGCSFGPNSGTYFTNLTVVDLIDLPWVIYMAYAVLLGDRAFSASSTVLNNIDLYRTARGLSNGQAFSAIQAFMFITTVYYDPVYNNLVGMDSDLRSVLELMMLIGNMAIRVSVFPSSFNDVSSTNTVFIVVAGVQALCLNPFLVITRSYHIFSRLLQHPMGAVYRLCGVGCRSCAHIICCCCTPCRANHATFTLPEKQSRVSDAAPPPPPYHGVRLDGAHGAAPNETITDSVVHAQPGNGVGEAITMTSTDLTSVERLDNDDSPSHSVVEMAEIDESEVQAHPARHKPPRKTQQGQQHRFVLQKIQDIFESCDHSGSGSLGLVEFVSFCNALSVAARSKPVWTSTSSMHAFEVVHGLLQAHLSAGGTLDAFFSGSDSAV